jgi:hypothetical protein
MLKKKLAINQSANMLACLQMSQHIISFTRGNDGIGVSLGSSLSG